MNVIAIDPGNAESAYVWIDYECRPIIIGKALNAAVRDWLEYGDGSTDSDVTYAIEMIASYGMAVGADVFETCVWVGRFAETIDRSRDVNAELVFRSAVKMHHCHTTRVKDPNIVQALIDRFAPGVSNKGKGTKASPGWFYGFHSDIWQAYALAVYIADTAESRKGAA